MSLPPTLRVRDALPIPGEVPRLLHHDADLLVVHKPAGWLTHADGADEAEPGAGRVARPAVVEHLRADFGALGVHSRLDVDTTGVLVLSRSRAGAARLQAALADGRAHKRYLAVVDAPSFAAHRPGLSGARGTLHTPINGKPAETAWSVLRSGPVQGTNAGADAEPGFQVLALHPRTGRTHQIRAQLAAAGAPIRGDARYGDPLDRRAPRTLLHCAAFGLPDGPTFEAPPPGDFARFLGLPPAAARAELAADAHTTAWRALDGAHDGHPGLTVDHFGDWLWVQQAADRPPDAAEFVLPAARGVCRVEAFADRSRGQQPPPAWVAGEPAPGPFVVYEHGVAHVVSLGDQLSTGLFLDQRPQRAWLAAHAGGLRVLNLFAHAGGFSVAAAVAGAETVSVDLSRRWLEVLPRSLEANGLDPTRHDRIFGDVFDWARRLAKRGEQFDLVILDPPSTSVGTHKKRWSAARDYGALVALVSPLVRPGGALWACTNHRGLSPARFAAQVRPAAPPGARLERIAPPAVDFLPLSGPAAVKNHCWRWPQEPR